MDWSDKLHGFYAVLDRDDRKLAEQLLSAARTLQVRLKGAARSDLLRIAAWARQLTRERGSLLVVNDDLGVALEVAADAVHLGQDDLPLGEARNEIARCGAILRVGLSTHDLDQVARALAGGADYLGFGPVYQTRTKAHPDPTVGLGLLARAVRAAFPVPVVAIGGITPARAAAVAATGAHAACAIAAVNRDTDPAGAGAHIAAAFPR
jgi:thiamine-phosphate pyrophosphorylase